MKINISIVLLTLFLSCKEVKKDLNEKHINNVLIEQKPSCIVNIEKSVGMLVIDFENFKNDEIKILNNDSTVYGVIDQSNISKYRRSFYCISENEKEYLIDIEGKQKTVPKNDELLSLVSLEDFFRNNIFSVNFNFEENPIRDSINGSPIINKKSNNYRLSVLDIKGFWMKVKYEEFNSGTSTEGWILWRDKSCAFIEYFHFG